MNTLLSNHHCWAAQELATANFGDARLTKRLVHIVADKLANPTASIPLASRSWAATKATYRFFASKQVAADTIRAAHLDATRARCVAHDTVLVLQDTTELVYTAHPHTTGLGALDHAGSRGLKVHSALAATIDGVPLGLVYQSVWARPAPSKARKPRKRPPQVERESQRWLTTLVEAQKALPAPLHLIVVADREADIYPLFIEPREQRTDLVIRATYNRGLVGGVKLQDVAKTVSWQGSRTVSIPGNGSRVARTATVQIGWTSVQLLPPQDYPRPASAPRPTLQLVVVEEREPPVGVKPLRWLLWTSLPVTSWEQAIVVVEAYRARWLIERYHYVLKSGCGVEQVQLETAERLERALAVCCIVAWRLLWLTYQARKRPEVACTEVFARHEWEALVCTIQGKAEPPAEPPSLREAVRMVAQLGGFLGRSGDGEPGVKTLWRGLIRLEDIAATWLLLRGGDPPSPQSLMGNG
ncbi:MAG TPA: IS4 family transposase [Giesbergeria sp.]|nr:IS4 family transposase [Giesbergeria sp.]